MSFYSTSEKPVKELNKLLDGMPGKRFFTPSVLWHTVVDPNWGSNIDVEIEDYRLVFMRGGAGNYWVNGNELPLERGRVIFLTPGTRFRMIQLPGDRPHLVTGRLELFERDTSIPLPPLIFPFGISLLSSDTLRTEQLFLNMFEAYENRNNPYYNELLGSCVHTVLMNIVSELKIHQSGGSDSRINLALQYLRDHPLENIDWSKLAKRSNLSRDYFSKIFLRVTGCSPKSYHLKIKMEYARFILSSSNLTLQEVADLLGYADSFIFSRQFKRTFGISPSQLRK